MPVITLLHTGSAASGPPPYTVLFLDGTQHYDPPMLKWAGVSAGASATLVLNGLRRRVYLKRDGTENGGLAGHAVPQGAGGFVLSALIAPVNVSTNVGGHGQLLGLGGVLALRSEADGRVSLWTYTGLGAYTFIAQSAAAILTSGTYRRITLVAYIHATAGHYDVRIDGTSVLSGSGVDTRGGQSVTGIAPQIGAADRTGDYQELYASDVYFLGGDSTITDLTGIPTIVTRYPAADGSPLQWTPSAAGSHYVLVNEPINRSGPQLPPNYDYAGDQDYVATSTVGNRDSYVLGTGGPTGTVAAVQTFVEIYARYSTANLNRHAVVYTRGGSAVLGPDTETPFALSADLVGANPPPTCVNLDPLTGAAWTRANLDTTQFGIQLRAIDAAAGTEVRLAQMVVEVLILS